MKEQVNVDYVIGIDPAKDKDNTVEYALLHPDEFARLKRLDENRNRHILYLKSSKNRSLAAEAMIDLLESLDK